MASLSSSSIVLCGLLAAGCGGGSNPTYKVGASSLTVRDQGYYYADDPHYCAAGGNGQMMLDFVDFNYICDPVHPQARDTTQAHTELRIILTPGLAADAFPNHPNMKAPFDSTPGITVDCKLGPGDIIIGEFLHYPAGAADPDTVQIANSAHLQFAAFDQTKKMPNVGTFDLHFGADEVKDQFSISSCN